VRGQAHTLEGIAAALVVLGGVVFALQATAVTPLTASTSNQHIENQQRAIALDLLRAAEDNETITETVLRWNATRGAFNDTGPGGAFTNGGPPTAFGAALNRTFSSDNVAFNVEIRYQTRDGESERTAVVDMGTPTDNAVSASHSVVLFDGDTLTGTNRTVADAAAAGEFYAEDVHPAGKLFAVLEVRITVWRI
jgi:hypothetical protein